MTWLGGALGGETVAAITFELNIPSFTYSNQISLSPSAGNLNISGNLTQDKVRYHTRTDDFFLYGDNYDPNDPTATTARFQFQWVRFFSTRWRGNITFRLLHNTSTQSGKKGFADTNAYQSVYNSRTYRMIATHLDSGISYDTNSPLRTSNINILGNGALSNTWQYNGFNDALATINVDTMSQDVKDYADDFVSAVSSGGWVRVEVFQR